MRHSYMKHTPSATLSRLLANGSQPRGAGTSAPGSCVSSYPSKGCREGVLVYELLCYRKKLAKVPHLLDLEIGQQSSKTVWPCNWTEHLDGVSIDDREDESMAATYRTK